MHQTEISPALLFSGWPVDSRYKRSFRALQMFLNDAVPPCGSGAADSGCLRFSLSWYLFSTSVLRQAWRALISSQLVKFYCDSDWESLRKAVQSWAQPSSQAQSQPRSLPCPGSTAVTPVFMEKCTNAFHFFTRTKPRVLYFILHKTNLSVRCY